MSLTDLVGRKKHNKMAAKEPVSLSWFKNNKQTNKQILVDKFLDFLA